jgi:hypothetical protein
MDSNKYTEAVRLLNHCRDVEYNVELHVRLDLFTTHLLDNFPTPDATDPAQVDAGAALLQRTGSDLEAAVREIPPDMEDVLYPVALMRVALAVYQIPLNPAKMMKTFDRFHKAYGKFIMDATDRSRLRHALPRVVVHSKTAEQAQDEIAASTGRTNNA